MIYVIKGGGALPESAIVLPGFGAVFPGSGGLPGSGVLRRGHSFVLTIEIHKIEGKRKW